MTHRYIQGQDQSSSNLVAQIKYFKKHAMIWILNTSWKLSGHCYWSHEHIHIHKYAGVRVCIAGIIHKAEKNCIFMLINTSSLGTIQEIGTLLTVLGMGSEQATSEFFFCPLIVDFPWSYTPLTVSFHPVPHSSQLPPPTGCMFSESRTCFFLILFLCTENTSFLALGEWLLQFTIKMWFG